jgi:hypothetical protein
MNHRDTGRLPHFHAFQFGEDYHARLLYESLKSSINGKDSPLLELDLPPNEIVFRA